MDETGRILPKLPRVTGVIVLRYARPDIHRPFRGRSAPFCWV